jgi:hypothetical protein
VCSSDLGIAHFVEDDTLYDVTCWAHQHGGLPTSSIHNKGATNNSRDAAFITFGAKGAYPERITRRIEDPLTEEVITHTVALEVKDNHKFYSGHRLHGKIKRLEHPSEAYRQKALERNHKRQGIYARIAGRTRTNNPDFDGSGNLIDGIELDFDHVPEGNHPDANLRLFVDDKESWYRYDRLPSVSGLDEEPVGVDWNHPDAQYHRTTVWSGNGLLYIEHATRHIVLDRYCNNTANLPNTPTIAPLQASGMMLPIEFEPPKQANTPIIPQSKDGCCGQNISYK